MKKISISSLSKKMQHLFNLKSLLTPTSPSSTRRRTPSPEYPAIAPISLNNDATTATTTTPSSIKYQKPVQFRKSLQESTKRLTNLLHANMNIRSLATKSTTPQAAATAETKRSSKFLRSSSINFMENRQATNDINDNNEDTSMPCNVTGPNTSGEVSRKQLLQMDQLERVPMLEWLHSDLNELINHFEVGFSPNLDDNVLVHAAATIKFMETNEVSSVAYFQLASHAKLILSKCDLLCKQIEPNAHLYDFSEQVKANGYRSILSVYDSACRHLLLLVSDLNEKKNTFLFQLKLMSSKPLPKMNTNLKDFQAWVLLLEKIELVLLVASEMQTITLNSHLTSGLDSNASLLPSLPSSSLNTTKHIGKFHSHGPSLFYHAHDLTDTPIENHLLSLASVHQEAFFGRTVAFQFCDSLKMPLTLCAVALASYNDGYEAFTPSVNVLMTMSNSSSSSNKENSSPTSNSSSNSHAASPGQSMANPDSSSNSLLSSSSLSNSNSNSNSSQSIGGTLQPQQQQQPLPQNVTQQLSNIQSLFGQAAKTLFSSTKYAMDPELRGKKISSVMKNADINFCKAFWQLVETPVVQVGTNIVTPTLAINIVKRISLGTSLKLPKVDDDDDGGEQEYVEILPPAGCHPNEFVKIRILSYEMLQGMEHIYNTDTTQPPEIHSPVSFDPNNQPSLSNFKINSNAKRSPYLILHAHGGGFIAQSSQSHEIYLKPWCKQLRIPIVSIDYALAPEHPFPRAAQECFFVYAWCLLNKDMLGWTGDKIICVGDSAGGVLVTNVVQQAIINKVRIPDALVPIYTPFLATYSMSPSRLLAVMDPLLNLGILFRCVAAYCGFDVEANKAQLKMGLNIIDQNGTTTTTAATKATSKSIRFSKSQSVSFDENKPPIPPRPPPPPVTQQDTATILNNARLERMHKIMGDSYFLIEQLKNHNAPHEILMSPLLSDDTILAKFPHTCLITTNLDPLLDDNIELKKKLDTLNVTCNLNVVNGLHHGFLNFITVDKSCMKASKFVCATIKMLQATVLEVKKATKEE
jgi:hormone-sensitive lipase